MQSRTAFVACVMAVSICVTSGAGAKHKASPPTKADLESAIVQSPSTAAPWLELARYHDAHGEQVPAVFGYVRFSNPEPRRG